MVQEIENAEEKFFPVPYDLGFVYPCEKEDLDNGHYVIRNLPDQDYIHCHKKLINHLDHVSREMVMGQYVVHMNHPQLVWQLFGFAEHNLGYDDVHRRDRQNWRTPQKITMPCVRACLQKIQDGFTDHPPNPLTLGTIVYITMVWHYVGIFCCDRSTLAEKVKKAAILSCNIPHDLEELGEQISRS